MPDQFATKYAARFKVVLLPWVRVDSGKEGEICAIGQTMAAQDLCPSLRPYMRMHHVQTGVGHYGVFNGKRWETQVYPLVRNTIYTSS